MLFILGKGEKKLQLILNRLEDTREKWEGKIKEVKINHSENFTLNDLNSIVEFIARDSSIPLNIYCTKDDNVIEVVLII